MGFAGFEGKGGGGSPLARTLPQHAPEFPAPLAISVFQAPSGTSNLSKLKVCYL